MQNTKLSRSSKLTFFIGFFIAFIYFAAWYFFRHEGWRTAFNIPGFILLFLSMPWSLPAMDNVLMIKLADIVGSGLGNFLQSLLISFGFALNFLLVKLFFSAALRKLKKK